MNVVEQQSASHADVAARAFSDLHYAALPTLPLLRTISHACAWVLNEQHVQSQACTVSGMIFLSAEIYVRICSLNPCSFIHPLRHPSQCVAEHIFIYMCAWGLRTGSKLQQHASDAICIRISSRQTSRLHMSAISMQSAWTRYFAEASWLSGCSLVACKHRPASCKNILQQQYLTHNIDIMQAWSGWTEK